MFWEMIEAFNENKSVWCTHESTAFLYLGRKVRRREIECDRDSYIYFVSAVYIS